MPSHKRKYQEEADKNNETCTPQIPKINKGLFSPLTPKTLGLISLCSEIESDIATLKNNADETLKLKNLLEKNTNEKLELIKKLDKLEIKSTEKDCFIKLRLSLNEENEKLKPIKAANNENIQCLKAAILKYQDENKKYKNISSNVIILNEQLESSNACIQAQQNQLKNYKDWIDLDRPAIQSQMEELRKDLKQESKMHKITIQELNLLKVKHDLVLKDFQKAEESNSTLIIKLKALTDELRSSERKLAETIAFNSRAIESRDAYKDILDTYSEFSVTDSFVEKCLKARCKKVCIKRLMMETLVIESDDQCTKLQIPASLTPIFWYISVNNLSEKCKSDLKNCSKY
ncbi:LOW QUALITY PROTEIN: hypothetical protein MXB_1544 [Myxobolus squamalis]|nr:LOW QUALITY PROTEIN: hypothetical protein MXB_1544 [Myxobolus squamalis]